MSGIGDMAKNALDSDKGEQVSDGALGKAADAAESKVGHKDQIDKAEQAADDKIGS